jgi:predicted small secreted protein
MTAGKKMTRKIALMTVLAASLLATACNTVRGLGRDVQSVGKTVEKTTN